MITAVVISVTALAGACLYVRALAGQLDRLMARFEAERAQWFRERQLLLNRIKPETAQAVADPTLAPGPGFPSAVPYDDDEAFWESKDALAERLAQEERLNVAH